MIFSQEIASRKIFLGAYLALKFQKKHKNEVIRRKARTKNTRRHEKHARKKTQKKFHRSLRIRRPGVRVPSSAPKAIYWIVGCLFCYYMIASDKNSPPASVLYKKADGEFSSFYFTFFKLFHHVLQQLSDWQICSHLPQRMQFNTGPSLVWA